MNKQYRPWRRAALAAALLAGTSLGGFALGPMAWADNPAPVNPSTATPAPAHALADFSGLVAQVKPAVVSITTKMKATPAAMQDEDGNPMPGRGMGPQLPFPFGQMVPHGGAPQKRSAEARGSGFIIDAAGTVVTNNHVVKGATSVTVTLDDGTELPAKVIGTDPRTDIAVLKVKSDKPLPYIQLGNSRDVKPGEWVVAMGNPFGLGGTVTAGIVSAVSRDIGSGPYDQFIQIDAPINQGNSGGPLFTQDGKVIGMNTAILSPTGGSVGIGFAVPSDMIRTVTAQLEKSGHVTRGYMGVETQPVTAATAKALKLPENGGALLAGVSADSPAAKAGLQPGDVIQAVNGTKVSNPRDLALNVAAIQPGQDANLTVLRDGAQKDMTVKVGSMPDQKVASNETGAESPSRGQLGVALAQLSPEIRSQLDLPEGTKGAVVERVRPGSPAEAAGLQPGDVIVGVNTQSVTSPSEAVKALKGAMSGDNKAVALRIYRNGQAAFVGVNLDQSNQG
ncbi:MAG: DegQ family serine endoprotease [Acetobacteraceae bacterium]|nr:DegQ family serine endoprotease [Pseudomonadota bacterium]